MVSHIIFTQIDEISVGFSRRWIKDILRSHLIFKGPILTDDLNMEGANISIDYSDRMIAARKAGCDFTLLCNNRKGVVQILDKVPHVHHMVEKEKWELLRNYFSPANGLLAENKRWIRARELLKNISC
jgi:beta-N-acetylhexosaminidase